MSMLSSALSHFGIPRGVQQRAMGLAGGIPGVGGLISIADAAANMRSPFSGVVPPGGSGMVNSIFHLGETSGGRVSPGPNGACPRGYHLNKHDLPGGKRVSATGKLTVCVRNRHMHALNSRAATRALRRLKRADKMTRKIHHLFHRPARQLKSGPFGRKK